MYRTKSIPPNAGIECDGCENEASIALVGRSMEPTPEGNPTYAGLALCQPCVIRCEALLRSARKSGPRVRNWGDAITDGGDA